jgi:hypothetical protein
MPIYFNSKIYKGNAEVKRLYRGENLLWTLGNTTAPTLTTTSLTTSTTSTDVIATLTVNANIAQSINEFVVAIRTATNPVDDASIDPQHLQYLSLNPGQTTFIFSRSLPPGNYNAHLAYQRVMNGPWTHDSLVVPFSISQPTQNTVSGVSASFDTASRTASVTWAQPRTGLVSATRTDSTGATGTKTNIDASLGTYQFTAAIATAATSLTVTVTAENNNQQSATITIPSGSTTTPVGGTNPLVLRSLTAGASVSGATDGKFNTFAGSRVNGLYATWAENGHYSQQEINPDNGNKIQGGKVWALVLGSGSEYGSGKLSSLGRFDLDVAPQFGIRYNDLTNGSWQSASTSTAMRTWLTNVHFPEIKNSWWGDANQRLYYRPCHEFNGNWYRRWRVEVADVAYFKTWWKNILWPAWVDAGMADDPRFLLEWCPNRDSSYSYDIRTLYPGADVVDVNGIDYYDFGWQNSTTYTDAAWDSEINSTQNGGPRGIETHRQFAADNGKALIIPETGQQFRDNPWFVNKLFPYLKANGYAGAGSPSGKIVGWAWHNLRGNSPDPNAGGDFWIQDNGGIYSGRPNASLAYQNILKGGGLRTV